jgi:hypothetical protein
MLNVITSGIGVILKAVYCGRSILKGIASPMP